jgi:peptidoglycan/LPS O-acetylase OafA/YrhL
VTFPTPIRKRVETILARDFVNELCRNGGKAAVAWLRRIRRLFPGCVLVIADYYGRLGTSTSCSTILPR